MSACSLQVFRRAKTSIETPIQWSVSFYLSSKRNRKFKHLVQTKPMGENIITNIMKLSLAGTIMVIFYLMVLSMFNLQKCLICTAF